jgi:hypothetical protein
LVETARATFRNPAIKVYSYDVTRPARFYTTLGFRETFRTPDTGPPAHVEVTLDGLTHGIASVDAAIAHHGLSPDLDGRPLEIVLWTDDTNGAYAHLIAAGAPRSAHRTTSWTTCALPGWRTRTAIPSSSFSAAERSLLIGG